MLRKNVWIVLLFAVVLLPSSLLAQEMMHGKWWHDKSIGQELGLTDSEKKGLEDKYIASRRKMIELKGEIERQRFELDLLLGTRDADEQQIIERFDGLEQARAKLSKERFEMLMAVRQTIGAERFQDLNLMYRDRDRRDAKRFKKDRGYRRDDRD